MSKESEKLVEQLNEQTDVIEKMREGLERIIELEDDDEAGAAKVIAKELLGSIEYNEEEAEVGEEDEDKDTA